MRDIRLLRSILNDSLDALEAAYESNSLQFPSLDEPHTPNTEAELFATDPEIRSIIDTTVAASYQLLCTLRHPFLNLADASSGYHLAACLRVAERFNIPEILRNAGKVGLHVDVIAAQAEVEPTKLARILRVLATHHIFREIRPNVFANNRTSAYFSTSRDPEEIRADPSVKYRDGSGAAAAGYIGTFTDDVFKAASYLLENLEDKSTATSISATGAALQKSIGTDLNYFSWLEQTGNEYRLTRFGACIQGSSLWDPPDTITQGFDWASVDQQGLVVDVGGGLGAPSMILAKEFPNLKIVIQDREAVIQQGKEHWQKTYHQGPDSGRVSFMAHDFFSVQPIQSPSIFLVRVVCHNWSDDLVVHILANLRAAAGTETRLVIADYIMPYACPADVSESEDGTVTTNRTLHSEKPAPLLRNLGKAGFNAYYIDMTMEVMLNGQERTLSHQTDLAAKAGWKVVQCNRARNSHFGYLVATPL